MKKGFIFTMDAMIALSVMIMIVLTIAFVRFETILPEKRYEKLNFVADDTMNMLAHLEVHEVQDTPTIKKLIDGREIVRRDLNKTVLDLIASFWYKGNYTIAENISRDVLEGLTDDICLNLTLGEETMYSSCSSSPKEVALSSRIESGYEPGKPAYGYVARAFLTRIRGKRDSSYAYFGGYVGDGNLTRILTLPNYDSILEAYMEFDIGNNFSLYINGSLSGSYIKGSSGGGNMTADKWYLTASNFSFFEPGENVLQINFTNRSYVGGGYFRVTYNTSELAPEEYPGYEKSLLPGIDGVINLYDSFYVPGNLTGMKMVLNFSSLNESLFVDVGNTTVYYGNLSTTILNDTLSVLLNYDFLSQKTIPLRIGHFALNATDRYGNVTDVILTTSRVDEMNKVDIPEDGTNISRIEAAKDLDKIFVNVILNGTGNRVGLVSYKSTVPTDWIIPLTDNNETLMSEIDGYVAKPGQRCLCCALYDARELLKDPLRKRVIVLMSDGDAAIADTAHCPLKPPGPPSDEAVARQAAINEACAAYENYGIKVYAIGFGPDANNTLLQEIAACGGGEWRASTNYTGLLDIYKSFATEISEQSVIYEYQKVVSADFTSILFPDSYVEFNFTPEIIASEYGEISLKRDGDRISSYSGDTIDEPCKEGRYNISQYERVVDAKMTSYSSQYWTDRLLVNTPVTGGWQTVFNLTDFGYNYLTLGDPYIVQIPVSLIDTGNNYVCIGTGFNVTNATGGSPDDRLIYTVRVKGSVGYGDVFNTSSLAVNDATQRLIDTVSDYVNVTVDDIDIGTKALKGIYGLWGPTLLKVIVWENKTTT